MSTRILGSSLTRGWRRLYILLRHSSRWYILGRHPRREMRRKPYAATIILTYHIVGFDCYLSMQKIEMFDIRTARNRMAVTRLQPAASNWLNYRTSSRTCSNHYAGTHQEWVPSGLQGKGWKAAATPKRLAVNPRIIIITAPSYSACWWIPPYD